MYVFPLAYLGKTGELIIPSLRLTKNIQEKNLPVQTEFKWKLDGYLCILFYFVYYFDNPIGGSALYSFLKHRLWCQVNQDTNHCSIFHWP